LLIRTGDVDLIASFIDIISALIILYLSSSSFQHWNIFRFLVPFNISWWSLWSFLSIHVKYCLLPYKDIKYFVKKKVIYLQINSNLTSKIGGGNNILNLVLSRLNTSFCFALVFGDVFWSFNSSNITNRPSDTVTPLSNDAFGDRRYDKSLVSYHFSAFCNYCIGIDK